MACSPAGMIRIGKMKPESRIAGSIDVSRPTWKASAWVSAMRRDEEAEAERADQVEQRRDQQVAGSGPRITTPNRTRAATRMMAVASSEIAR